MRHNQPSTAEATLAQVALPGRNLLPEAGGAHGMPPLQTEKGHAPSTLLTPTKEGVGDWPEFGGLQIGVLGLHRWELKIF